MVLEDYWRILRATNYFHSLDCIFKTEATTEREISAMLPLLLAGSTLRILLTLAHYYLVAAFVKSKPPGRKMVWEIHCRYLNK